MDESKSRPIGLGGRIAAAMDAVCRGMWIFSAALVFFITALVCVAVLLRYYLRVSVGWTTELTEYCIFLIVMFGAPWVLKRDQHVNVDVVINLVNPGIKRYFNIFTSFVGALVCAAIVYYGSLAFHENFVKGTLMVKILPIPKWLPILFIPVMAFFSGYQFLAKAVCFTRQGSPVMDAAPEKERKMEKARL